MMKITLDMGDQRFEVYPLDDVAPTAWTKGQRKIVAAALRVGADTIDPPEVRHDR